MKKIYSWNSHVSEKEVVMHIHRISYLVCLCKYYNKKHGEMADCIPNTIKFYKLQCGKGLRFEPPMHLIPSIATSMGSKEKDPILSM